MEAATCASTAGGATRRTGRSRSVTSSRARAPACSLDPDSPPASDLLIVRAGVVGTGTERLSGRVQDRNGPWVGDRLAELGVELAHVMIAGDRREDLLAALR